MKDKNEDKGSATPKEAGVCASGNGAANSRPIAAPILKARKGEACNGCGLCCQQEACPLSMTLLQSDAAPCVALIDLGGGYFRCGLMLFPSRYLHTHPSGDFYLAEAIRHVVGAGQGCCSDDEELLRSGKPAEKRKPASAPADLTKESGRPLAGAVRAAKGIIATAGDRQDERFLRLLDSWTPDFARVIQRESGLEELRLAARECQESLVLQGRARLRAALQRVEEP